MDLDNRLVHIRGSKTLNGGGDVPMTEPAHSAFIEQMGDYAGSDHLFPTLKKSPKKPFITSLKTAWTAT